MESDSVDPEFAVDLLAQAIIREYLSRKGNKKTLACFDQEQPRDSSTITNRLTIIKNLHIEKIVRKNKDSEKPLGTLLEVLVSHLLSKPLASSTSASIAESLGSLSLSSEPGTARSSSSMGGQIAPISARPSSSMSRSSRVGDGAAPLPSSRSFLADPALPPSGLGRSSADLTGLGSKTERPKSAAAFAAPPTPSVDTSPALVGHTNSRLVKPNGSISGQSLRIEDLVTCEVYVTDVSSQVTIDNCSFSKMLIGPVDGSVFIRNCRQCHFYVACRQFRCRDCENCEFTLFCATQPGIESSTHLLFSPWNVTYPGSDDHFKISKLDQSENKWKRIYDFSKDDVSVPQPHFQASALLADQTDLVGIKIPTEGISRLTSAHGTPQFSFTAPFNQMSASSDKISSSGGRPSSALKQRAGAAAGGSSTHREKDVLNPSTSTSTQQQLVMEDVEELNSGGGSGHYYNRSGSSGGTSRSPADFGSATQLYTGISPSPTPTTRVVAEQLGVDMARKIRKLILGHPQRKFYDSWRQQGLFFCTDVKKLRYGLVQHTGGPCGVLAVLQAYVLKELLFTSHPSPISDRFPSPSPDVLESCLVTAMTTILWKMGGERSAKACIVPHESMLRSSDVPIEDVRAASFSSRADLAAFLSANLRMYQDHKGPGVVLLLISAVLSRGIDRVISDMDDLSSSLIVDHGHCSQELVNLFATGAAHTHCFDGVQSFESDDGKDCATMRGIARRSEVGFLSLFEKFGYYKVGDNYKVPQYPIWVVCSESHYTTLFARDPNDISRPVFDLYYYDGLARQDEEIRLTVDTTQRTIPSYGPKDLVPPLDECIRTKWMTARVSWNGTDPLL